MVRAKPELFLTVPNALDLEMYSRADLITPPCYIVSAPPPFLTPALSRSSSLSTNISQSESDCELEDEEEDVCLRSDPIPWTIDQDDALLSVFSFPTIADYQNYSAESGRPALPSVPFEASRPPTSVAARPLGAPFVVVVGEVVDQYRQRADDSSNWRTTTTWKITRNIWQSIHSTCLSFFQGTHISKDDTNESVLRVSSHPYARSNLPFGSKELHLRCTPLASPFPRKQLDFPSSPSLSTSRMSLPRNPSRARECHW